MPASQIGAQLWTLRDFTKTPAQTVRLLREMRVDVIAVHGAAAHAGNPVWDFFSTQEWTRVVRFPNDEFVVLVTR